MYLLGLRAPGAASSDVLDSLVLLKGAEAVDLDRRVVNKDICAPVVGSDEPIALILVEPFNSSMRHFA
jgi:hypothetical protein